VKANHLEDVILSQESLNMRSIGDNPTTILRLPTFCLATFGAGCMLMDIGGTPTETDGGIIGSPP
jgi:hypothetical protein